MARNVQERVVGKHTQDGAGVHLTRVLSLRQTKKFDPFLMLDFFDSDDPADYVAGFPWHPHRGIETVTFLVEGRIDHGDSLGNSGTIHPGDCQWMTAGSGIVHQEMPQPSERMFGVQLWVNLPASHKMTTPKYRDLRKADIPVLQEDNGSTVRVIAGTYGDVTGPAEHVGVHTLMLEIQLPALTAFEMETLPEPTVFAFLQQGEVLFEGVDGPLDVPPVAVLFERGEGVRFESGASGARLLLISGDPLNEPIAWGGPIVMNSKEELDQAFAELDAGTFLKTVAED